VCRGQATGPVAQPRLGALRPMHLLPIHHPSLLPGWCVSKRSLLQDAQGELAPEVLVKLSTAELASRQLSAWRHAKEEEFAKAKLLDEGGLGGGLGHPCRQSGVEGPACMHAPTVCRKQGPARLATATLLLKRHAHNSSTTPTHLSTSLQGLLQSSAQLQLRCSSHSGIIPCSRWGMWAREPHALFSLNKHSLPCAPSCCKSLR